MHVNTAGIEGDQLVIDEGVPAVHATRHADAVLREMPDRAANDIELFPGEKLHVIEAGAEAFDVETLESTTLSVTPALT